MEAATSAAPELSGSGDAGVQVPANDGDRGIMSETEIIQGLKKLQSQLGNAHCRAIVESERRRRGNPKTGVFEYKLIV